MRAHVAVREAPLYRRDAFCDGLRSCGYEIGQIQDRPSRADLLLIWNRYGRGDALARRYEAAGATVVVAENGYCGREWNGGTWYSLALNWNAGAGRWPVGGPERAAMFHVEPWRTGGDYALVLAQRGIGTPPVAQSSGWHQRAAKLLVEMGHRVEVRGHPGAKQHNDTLYAQLDGAKFVVTWASGAAVKALLYGVPVYCGFNRWIGASVSRPFGRPLPEPFRGDRSEFLTRLAWAQWSVEEIGSGHAFRHLLRATEQALQPGALQRAG